jgi:dihydromethanopterin reductase (acceptor)
LTPTVCGRLRPGHTMSIAWGITGAGHFLRECVNLVLELGGADIGDAAKMPRGETRFFGKNPVSAAKMAAVQVDVFLSRAAEEVLRMYGLADEVRQGAGAVVRDNMSSAPVVGRFAQPDRYRALVVAPATSNAVAKFVRGISDSLITNLFAQAGKNRVPILVLPTDLATEMDTITPSGRTVKVYPRAIDLENTARLREFPNVMVAEDPEGLRCLLQGLDTCL